MAHLDTYAAQSDADSDANLGGLTLQGIDDNAAGVGVMLELAEKLKERADAVRHPIYRHQRRGRRQTGRGEHPEANERRREENTLLVINLDNLIVGDKLYFNSGKKTPEAVRKLTRDRALAIAHSRGIRSQHQSSLNKDYPKGTGCCNDAEVFDDAGIAVLSVEATNWNPGKKDGYQQRAKSASFPSGNSWHDVRLDNQQHIDKALPGRIEHRSRDVVRIMLPLVKNWRKQVNPEEEAR